MIKTVSAGGLIFHVKIAFTLSTSYMAGETPLMVTLLGTRLRLSSETVAGTVEMYFLRRLDSDEDSWAKLPCMNNKKRNMNRNWGVFNQFLLVMLKISIYCAGDGYSVAVVPAPKYSLFILAILDTEIPLGQTASHS